MSTDTPRTDTAEASRFTSTTPIVPAEFARTLERELAEATTNEKRLSDTLYERVRDVTQLRAEVGTLQTRHAAIMLHTQSVVEENTQLRAEVERLKIEIRVDTPKMLELNRQILSDNDRLRARIAELEQDKARLEHILQNADIYCHLPTSGSLPSARLQIKDRASIDAAMKGTQ